MSNKTRLQNLLEFNDEQPNDSFTVYAIALEYMNIGELEESKKFFSELLQNHKDYIAAYYHFGKLYEKMNNADAAGETYLLGIRLAEAKRDKHALAELKQAYNSLMGVDEGDW